MFDDLPEKIIKKEKYHSGYRFHHHDYWNEDGTPKTYEIEINFQLNRSEREERVNIVKRYLEDSLNIKIKNVTETGIMATWEVSKNEINQQKKDDATITLTTIAVAMLIIITISSLMARPILTIILGSIVIICGVLLNKILE